MTLGQHLDRNRDEALHRRCAVRQFTANLLGAKVLVGRQAEPSAVGDGNDCPGDFTRFLGPARAGRPGPPGSFG